MRYLVISDIHGNLEALKAVLNDAPAGLPVWCLGDLVGYGPNPNECIEQLRELEPECVVGNHDWAAVNRVNLEDFNPDAQAAVMWTQAQLTPQNRSYLQELPISLVKGSFTLVHGSPREPIWEYILYPPVARLNFAHFSTSYCLVGHTHIPMIFRFINRDGEATCMAERPVEGKPYPLDEGRLIINPGSVGQPRDGDARAAYAILDTDTLTLEHRRVSYDIAKTQRLMEEAGLPHRLIARLSYGW